MSAIKVFLLHWYIWITLVSAIWVTAKHDHSHAIESAWVSVAWAIGVAFVEWRARMLEERVERWQKIATDWKTVAKGWEQIAEEQER